MSSGVAVREGLPEPMRRTAALIYLDAFEAKIGPILGRGEKAVAYLTRVMAADRVLSAVDTRSGELLGLVGFHESGRGFIGGNLADLQIVYGMVGGAWRGLALALFERAAAPDQLLLDGICVAEGARGKGVGGTLIEAAVALAEDRGLAKVRLEVVDTNPRARALYERSGFVEAGSVRVPVIGRFFGFSASATMVRAV